MPSDEMSFILEMVCSSCASGNCTLHQPKILAKDRITGLEIEARCICRRCNARENTNIFEN